MPTAAVQLGGGAQKFGVDEEQLDDVLPQILKLGHLDLQGVHVFAATGVLESSLLVEYTRHVFDLVQRLERDYRQCFSGRGSRRRSRRGLPSVFQGRDLDLAPLCGPACGGLIATFGFGDKEIALELGALLGRRGWHLRRARARREALAGGRDYCPWWTVGTNHFRRPVAVRQDHPVTFAASRYRIRVRHRRGS